MARMNILCGGALLRGVAHKKTAAPEGGGPMEN